LTRWLIGWRLLTGVSDCSRKANGIEGQVRGDRVTLRFANFPPEEAEKAKDLLQSLPFVQEVIINSAQGNLAQLSRDDGE